MAEEKEIKAVGEAQEPLKKEKVYRVTCGTFRHQNEALQRAAETRKAGVILAIIIEKTEYVLLYAKGLTKPEAEAAKKRIEAKKIKAEVSEQ